MPVVCLPPSASGCPIANRNKMRSLEGGGGAGLGMGMGVPTGLAAMGEPRPPLLAASYSTGAPTGPPAAAHTLLARPLLHPLQPPPTKKLRMDDSAMTYKTGAFACYSSYPHSCNTPTRARAHNTQYLLHSEKTWTCQRHIIESIPLSPDQSFYLAIFLSIYLSICIPLPYLSIINLPIYPSLSHSLSHTHTIAYISSESTPFCSLSS